MCVFLNLSFSLRGDVPELESRKIFVCPAYLIGFVHVLQERAALVAPWIMGCVAFLALEAVAMVYSNVLRDHVNRVSLFYLRVCFLRLTLLLSGSRRGFHRKMRMQNQPKPLFAAEATLADDVLQAKIERRVFVVSLISVMRS